ncbi:hypothetical protein TYRP_005335 [Tyrophagus putrescentiae]|nr:hypothetical protein TYRP_005335 [Tyrophagus putrescentiae]
MVLIKPLNAYLVSHLRGLSQYVMEYKDKRLKLMHDILAGIFIRAHDPLWTTRQLLYAGNFCELFLCILKCLILPLIFCSLVFAIGNIDVSISGQIAMRTVIFYFATTFIAILIGIVPVILIAPGTRKN